MYNPFDVLKACVLIGTFGAIPLVADATVLPMPVGDSEMVGDLQYTKARYEDTLIDIAREFSIGQDEMVMANPTVDRWLPGEGKPVLIPKRFILPDAARVGIVVNIPEMRLYYFQGATAKTPATQIVTYPISIGRMDWRTPLGPTKVVAKQKDPVWRPPATIKAEHAKDGDILPDVVPAGPMNPLGRYAMRLGVPGYLIHGTGVDKADGIGMRVTHGCIRMYPEDIERLYPLVPEGTPVNLVNQPIKLGWDNNQLLIEVSSPLDEDSLSFSELYSIASNLIAKKTAQRPVQINQEALKAALQKPTGIPVLISGAHAGDFASATGPVPNEARDVERAPREPSAVTSQPQPETEPEEQPAEAVDLQDVF